MFRRLFTLLSLLSLLLCLATVILWFRSRGGVDTTSHDVQRQRYTATSGGGVLRLFGPPPPAANPAVRADIDAVVAALNNDQICWRGWYADFDDPPGFKFINVPEPDPDTSAEHAEKRFTQADLARPVLQALDDPARLTAAHVLLVRLSSGFKDYPSLKPRSLPGTRLGEVRDWPDSELYVHSAAPWSEVQFDGLRVTLNHWRYKPIDKYGAGSHPGNGGTTLGEWVHTLVGEPDISQIAEIRDQWHRRLDVEIASVAHWKLVGITALVPLLFLFTHLRRRRVTRRRGMTNACVHCGYDLRASSDRCPECGAVFSNT